jgi:hypothetical protein
MKASILPPLFLSVRLPTLLAMFWRAHISRAPIAGVSRKEPLSFIVFRLDSLGDVVLTTPLFRALKKPILNRAAPWWCRSATSHCS